MPTPEQYRRAMLAVVGRAVAHGQARLGTGTIDDLIADTTGIVDVYSDGTAALALDQHAELRDAARAPGRYVPTPVVVLRAEQIRRGTIWAAQPLRWDTPDPDLAGARLAEVIDLEVARAFYDTVTENVRRDPAAVGWQRITHHGACKFCEFLAARGAVYRAETARFAAHPGCGCSAVPVFQGQQVGPPADALQYAASARRKTPAQRQRLREALAAMPD